MEVCTPSSNHEDLKFVPDDITWEWDNDDPIFEDKNINLYDNKKLLKKLSKEQSKSEHEPELKEEA
ncbi:hypothetical protein AMTR_s00083p00045540 [Amborella trichopoda]|uniref:Uncharacterized protein n=1 Tax=Amborella trichopoda TaxID=13333 RepID=W1P4J9_AMBTC|nr:hypothetical protein AMTR_s00083p00045540 [Amborella trichopoda]